MPDTWLHDLTAQAPMPAVAVAVFDRDATVAESVHGVADLTTGRPVTRDCWWDLASLTKVLVTLPAVLRLGLPRDRPIGELWPRARGRAAGACTVDDLLAHRSGLPATVRFYETLHGPAIVDAALGTARSAPEPVYSDLGYIILGALVEDLTGRPLDGGGLRLGGPVAPAVATELCPWRGRLICGEVHDENAAALGGYGGHAGAFGTLDLVTAAARRSLGPLPPPCLAQNSAGERFAAGWWLHPARGLGGPGAGRDGFGASGFVGNRIWFEPSRGYGVVVLSNRIHPTRGDRTPYAAWCDDLLTRIATELT
ncbi:beta-lactamase family protein [Dactylosporangium vinaceum]|uniref:Serine hydrolase domain-containing protein n=1 Tax=Dactylosporangium vinaceum TaxID=53362 RepID=A0ABV5M466_9ACTN|nr:serine hydrolase domain-containing protein [Dactylosporangium vinaceum]UAB93454.1 beta-lactamase family protein [Dactylosporangium vinaceum]